MKWRYRLIIIFLAVILSVFIGISVFLGSSMTRIERVTIEEDPNDLGLEYEAVTFLSREDKLELHGWHLPSQDDKRIVIMVHGADMHRADPNIDMLGIASDLVNNGFNLLMFDLRGHGESEGERLSAGYYETRDLTGAVDFVKTLGYEHIGVLGFSMGGATALMSAAKNSDIDCVVADSSYADMTEIMKREFKERSGMPGFLLPPMLFMVKIMYGVDFNAVKPIEAVPNISPRPVMFIHGEDDTFVPPEHARRLYQASQNPANELWIAPDSTHVKSYINNKEEYINRVTTFLDKALK
jgi:fermentation-respiration switch protein FrsA (DUF1100 family)